MEIRKIQITGGASFIVSLPKEWARENNINKNDRIGIITRNDGSLLLTTKIKGEQTLKTKEINLLSIDNPSSLFRMLLGSYIKGYNIFKIKSEQRISPETREIIRSFIRAAIGLEIIEETSTSLTIKDLLDPTEMPFDKAIKRITNLVKNMHKDALFSLAYSDEAMAKDVIERDNDVDRLHWLISRQYNIVSNNMFLAEVLNFDIQTGANYSSISRTVERIGDHAVNIAANTIQIIDKKLTPSIIDIITTAGNKALDIFTDSVESFFKKDISAANKTIDSIVTFNKICEEIENVALQQTGVVSISVGYIGESIRRVGEYSADLAEYVINYLVEEQK